MKSPNTPFTKSQVKKLPLGPNLTRVVIGINKKDNSVNLFPNRQQRRASLQKNYDKPEGYKRIQIIPIFDEDLKKKGMKQLKELYKKSEIKEFSNKEILDHLNRWGFLKLVDTKKVYHW